MDSCREIRWDSTVNQQRESRYSKKDSNLPNMKYLHTRSLPANLACVAAFFIFILAPVRSYAVDLLPQTSALFDKHISNIEARLEQRYRQPAFLSVPSSGEKDQQLRGGSILVQPSVGNGNLEVKGGQIQDWTGALFIPSAKMADVLKIAQDFGRHAEIFKPDITAVKVRAHDGNRFQVYMRFVKSKFMLTDVLDAEYDIHFVQNDPKRAYSYGRTTRVVEVVDAGKPSEHELPEGKDRGLLWRTAGYWLFEERDGGVYVEWQSVSLTRDIPLGMGKLFGPILRSLPAESVRSSLDKTRNAVVRHMSTK